MTSGRIEKRIKCECDYIRTLANIYTCYGFRGNPDRIKLAMLTAYFDESGIHNGNHLCVVAGYIGNDAQWQSFIPEWMNAIKPRQNLHMRKIRKFKRAEKLLAELGPIPDRHHLQRVIGGVWWRDYTGIVKDRIQKRFTDPYMLAVQSCLFQTMGYLPRSDEIYISFSRQHVHEDVVMELDHRIFKERRTDPRIKDIHFSNPTSTVCFDPADYLAFEVREYKSNPRSEKAAFCSSILGDGNAVGYIWTPERLHEVMDALVSNREAKEGYKNIPAKYFPKSAYLNVFEGGNHET